MVRRPTPVVLLSALGVTAALVGASALFEGLGADAAGMPVANGPEPGSTAPVDAGAPATLVAFARDFREFRTWERHAVDGAMMPIGAAPGPSFVYVNRRASSDAQRWPVGTILVKTIESGAPSEWTIHAMVKRGVPYNAQGAVGWEFFELRLAEGEDEPSVLWRGQGPPSGHGYAAMGVDAGPDPIPLVCNDCHAAAWRNDGVLTSAISLR